MLNVKTPTVPSGVQTQPFHHENQSNKLSHFIMKTNQTNRSPYLSDQQRRALGSVGVGIRTESLK